MADIRDRGSPPGTRRRVSTRAVDTGSTELQDGSRLLGATNEDIENDPEQFFGELFQGAHFRSVGVPSSAEAGGTVTVTGTVHFDAPTVVVTTRGVRVRVRNTSTGETRTQSFENVQHCQTRDFSIDLPVPDSPGNNMALVIEAEHSKPLGGWSLDTTDGPHRVSILTEDEQQRQNLLGYAPWALGGGGAGLLVSSARGGGNRAAFTVGGAAAGVGLKTLAGGDGNLIPNVDPLPVLAVGAGLAGVAFFLQSSGASEVLEPVGSAAGSAVSGARRRLEGQNTAPTRY